MIIRFIGLISLLLFTTIANAEYYLVYEQPKSNVINLNFSPQYRSYSHPHKKPSHSRPAKNSVLVSCGCAPDNCFVLKRDVYTAAPTTCVTYGDVIN